MQNSYFFFTKTNIKKFGKTNNTAIVWRVVFYVRQKHREIIAVYIRNSYLIISAFTINSLCNRIVIKFVFHYRTVFSMDCCSF